MSGCYSIGQSCGLKLNNFLHQMIPQKSGFTHSGAEHVCASHKQILSSYMLCKQPHVCALSWELSRKLSSKLCLFSPVLRRLSVPKSTSGSV